MSAFAWAIGSQHTLTTTSPQGSGGTRYTFNQWSDGSTAFTDAVTVSSGTTSYTASFNTSYLLTTSQSPSADGSVGENPASPTSDGYYPAGAQITLTATADEDYSFGEWTGAGSCDDGQANSPANVCEFTPTSDETDSVSFIQNTVDITITASGNGRVSLADGANPTCTTGSSPRMVLGNLPNAR